MTFTTSELGRHVHIHRSFILRGSPPVHLHLSQYLKNKYTNCFIQIYKPVLGFCLFLCLFVYSFVLL